VDDAPVSSPDRQLGVDLFNGTWRLIESRDDDDLMLLMAYASVYHWAIAPECLPANRARGDWLLSRVYALLGRAEPARHHAHRCLEWCEGNELGDWDLAFAYEALARASRVAGDEPAVERYLAQARAVPIAEQDDREQLESDLATV
jgi:hypothetical protein